MPSISSDLRRAALSTRKLLLARLGREVRFSHFGEEEVIARLLVAHPPAERFCVDFGAGDGVEGSNTLGLFRAGWQGLAVEAEPRRFAFLSRVLASSEGVGLARCGVTPVNVVPLLRAYGIPTEFGFLDLDIDGYDYFVLDALLADFRPTLICVEINESFPPPLRFRVKWDPKWSYAGDHLHGFSIGALGELAHQHGYAIVDLFYNNAFLVPAERAGGAALTPEEAYQRGYLGRADRLERLPWNAELEPMQRLSPEEASLFFAERHPNRGDTYELTW
ncbi:hypothetical protein [Candidatus Solirubrobacter pratensis]|uniref:hypothetical protein n=1 Tax=Candidatus Solirubrobacter pratensis TaxID=1298857 RepID=UPI0004101EBF|nr:hypothetical protein [Candidatus Solirubrobacter pratensis]